MNGVRLQAERAPKAQWARRLPVAVLCAAAATIIPIGLRFLVRPEAAAAGFGLPAATGDPYLATKGVRDIASGLVLFAVLAHGDRRLSGRVALAAATTPIGDMLLVLRRGGRPGVALGVHGATALLMVAAAVPLLHADETAPTR